ncbi:MAG: TetR/AcrR family transcriptional regulator [Proteobacteria bacterium]|nr:TetR/AcrR family transcriptional regulator [Pseudomonadota bacterium]MDE2411353.1 TetR/AcrR family transcriptional regulator [Sphingomonadales bacterium]
MKTRDRIVQTALALFNEQGYGAVTTAALAAACGMSEGNLWYHFKTRQALLEAIGDQFAVGIEQRLAQRPADDPAGDYARLLETMMAEFRTYRFLYRDQHAYGEQTDPVRSNSPRWHEMTFDQIESYLAALVDAGLLDWPRERLRDLSINSTIILRYGLEHYREMGEPIAEGAGAVRRTLRRHLTLFEHRLDPAAAARLHAAIDAIEAPLLAA